MYSLKKLDELLDSFVNMGIPSFDIEIRHHGEKIYRRMHGYSDYEKTTPINGTEKYNIYSCSKPITCVSAMTLWEKGKFSLHDKLSDYMPEFKKENMTVVTANGVKKAEKDITIENLFTMSAGFTYNLFTENLKAAAALGDACTTREAAKYLARDPLAFEPSEKYSYSLCHDVLAALVEVISGERFGDYTKRVIFDKLGMENTTFLPDNSEIDGLCAQYRYNNDTKSFDNIGKKNFYRIGKNYESGGAGCVTTLDDYMKFLEAMRVGNVLISNETINFMSKNRLSPEQSGEYALKDLGYGYGLGIRCPMDEQNGPSDIGWGGAAAAYLVCDRKYDFTLYYAQHVLSSPNQSMRNLFPALVREALNAGNMAQQAVPENGNSVTY